MHYSNLKTSYDGNAAGFDVNESFLQNDIANIISKMYSPEDVKIIETLYKVKQSNHRLDNGAIDQAGFTFALDITRNDSTSVVDSSTSDSTSLPRGKLGLRRFRVVCECCRQRVSRRVVDKGMKTFSGGCKSCVKPGLHSEQTKDNPPTGDGSSLNNHKREDCNSHDDYSKRYLNHVKEIHGGCEICQSNLQYLMVHANSLKLSKNISDIMVNKSNSLNTDGVQNVHNPTNQGKSNSTTNLSTVIKPQSKSIFTLFKSCLSKESTSNQKRCKDVNENNSDHDKPESKTLPNPNDLKNSNDEICHVAQVKEKDAVTPEDCTVVEIRNNKLKTKTSIDWNQFWSDLFKPARLVLAIFSGFTLTLLEFFLDSLVRPLLWGTVQVVGKYFFQPCLETVFLSILHPIFVLLTNITSSTRDLFLPIAQCFGDFIKEFASGCRSCRIVEENITPDEIISQH